jgi:phosphate transport system permease protein
LVASPAVAEEGAPPFGRRSRATDQIFHRSTQLVAVGLVILLIALLVVLLSGSARVWSKFGLGFITGTNWNPVAGREAFGALPFIYGTLVTSTIAMALAVPVSVGLALLMNELRSGWLRNPLAAFVDVLAAIPSIVYGLWGLFVLRPALDHHVEPFLTATIGRIPVVGSIFHGSSTGPDLFTAGVILSIMVLPIVTALSREVIGVVPREQREAAKAIGATRYETIRLAVLPSAKSGIVGAAMIGLGRALGETIAVSLVVGNTPAIRASLLSSGATIPSWIASSFREATSTGLHRSALLGLAVVLVGVTFVLTAASRLLIARTRRAIAATAVPER